MTTLTVLHLVGCLALLAVFFAPPRTPYLVLFFKGILREYSVVLLVPALLTALVVAFAGRASGGGVLRWSTGTAALLVLYAALMPVVSALRTSKALHLPLQARDYFRPLVGDRPLPSQTVRFATVEGVDLHADVFLPDTPSSSPRPAVLYLHGGGWSGGERGYARAWADFFTARGYVLVSLDYRLFPPATGLKTPGDVQCGIAWVKAQAATYGIDPDRLVLFGESAGGHLATLAGYASGDPRLPPTCGAGDTPVKAVISFYASSDLVHEAEHLGSGTRRILEGFTGVPLEGHRELYALLSPINHVGPRSPPTLLLHGGADTVVPLHASRALAARLEQAGVPHQFSVLPYAEHAFDVWDGGFGRQLARVMVARFLQRHVPVDDAPWL